MQRGAQEFVYICIVLVLLKMFVDEQFHIFCCGVEEIACVHINVTFLFEKTEV